MGPKPDDRCSTCGAAGTRGEAVAFHTPRPPRPRAGRPGRGRPQPQGEHSLPTPLSRRPGPGRGWGHGSVREPPPPRHLLWQPPAERTAVVRPDAGAGPSPATAHRGRGPDGWTRRHPHAPTRSARTGLRPPSAPCSMAPREALSASHVRAPREALSWRPGAAATPDGPGSARRSRRQTAPHHWTDAASPGDGPAPEPRRPRSACPAPRARVRCPCRADAPGYSAALPTDTENGGERGWGAGRTTMGCTGRGLGAGRGPRRAEGGGRRAGSRPGKGYAVRGELPHVRQQRDEDEEDGAAQQQEDGPGQHLQRVQRPRPAVGPGHARRRRAPPHPVHSL